MTLIEGIGDEVTHFFIALFVIIIVTVAWWTTNISEQRHIRTVLLLERRRHRPQRTLTTNTEAVTITEGTNMPSSMSEDVPSTSDDIICSETINTEQKSSTVAVSDNAEPQVDNTPEETSVNNLGEEQHIIETMDADNCVLRQRRLAFYNNFNSDASQSRPQCSTESTELPETSSSNVEGAKMNVDAREILIDPSEMCTCGSNGIKVSNDKDGITIKLKYINDDMKLVDGKLDELLGEFKRRHFQPELSQNKLVRLIFNGQVLQPDTRTLQECGLFDNCVVHCLIHQKRSVSNNSAVVESRQEGYSFPNINGITNLNNNNLNRDWDLGNFLFAFISLILLASWYLRYVYAHLYTVTATVGLILITGIFTIVLVGMYFPDNENLPYARIRIARERVQSEQ